MNSRGYNTFHTAAKHKCPQILEILAAHRNGKGSIPEWHQHYLNRITEDKEKLTALRIACRNKDQESVEVLLKYLVLAYRQHKAQERLHLYKYKYNIRNEFVCELSNASGFIRELCIYTAEHEDILSMSFSMAHQVECSCTKNSYRFRSVKLADTLIKKCSDCLSKYAIHVEVLTHPPQCSDIDLFNVIGYLVDNNADISEYVLNRKLHSVVVNYFSRCSVRLLFRSFGMSNVAEHQINWLVNTYWKMLDYETLCLLFVSVSSDVLRQILPSLLEENERRSAEEEYSMLFLQKSIKQVTSMDADCSRLSPVQYMTYAARQPRILLNCCIITIRRCISSNVIKKAEHLPLPLILKNAVRLTKFQCRCSPSVRCHSWIPVGENF